MLIIATKKKLKTFKNRYYKQVDSIAMGSPLVPALANDFINLENRWLQNCPNYHKSGFYQQYVDDMFLAEERKEYLAPKHPKINFSLGKEKDVCLSSSAYPF